MLVLIGRNGVGKTNILKAIQWAAEIATASSITAEFSLATVGEVTLRFKIDEIILRYEVSLQLRPPKAREQTQPGGMHILKEALVIEEGALDVAVFARTGVELSLADSASPFNVGPLSPAAGLVLALAPDHPHVPLIRRFTSFLSGVKYYPLEEIETQSPYDYFISQTQYDAWRTTKAVRNVNNALMTKVLDLYLQRKDTFDELASLLGSDGLDVVQKLTVSSFDVPIGGTQTGGTDVAKTEKYYLIQFTPARFKDGSDFGFGSLSYGTRRVVRLLTSLLFDSATVSLIEQPEDGIHMGLLHKLVPILRSYAEPAQFVLTSHSTEVLNQVDPSEIRLVDLEDGNTAVRPLTAKEMSAAKSYMENDGPLSDFLESVQEL